MQRDLPRKKIKQKNKKVSRVIVDVQAGDKVIKTEGLTPSGKQTVGSVHGTHPTNAYSFMVGILFGQTQHVTGTVAANVSLHNVNGIECAPSPGFDVLLGRDIICQGSLNMTFDGHATLCL